MLSLQEYGSSDEDEKQGSPEAAANSDLHLKPIEDPQFSIKSQLQICAAPVVLPTVSNCLLIYVDLYCR